MYLRVKPPILDMGAAGSTAFAGLYGGPGIQQIARPPSISGDKMLPGTIPPLQRVLSSPPPQQFGASPFYQSGQSQQPPLYMPQPSSSAGGQFHPMQLSQSPAATYLMQGVNPNQQQYQYHPH